MKTKNKTSAAQKIPSFLIGNDFISIVVNSKSYTVYKSDIKFNRVLDIVRNKQWNKLENALDTAKHIAKYSYGKITVTDGKVLFRNKPMHNAVVDKILNFIKHDYPYKPLVRFLDKLMSNPSENSRTQCYSFLERHKMPISDDGDFLAYKGVNKSFRDKHTDSIDNSLGKLVKINRAKTNDNPNEHCSEGLHLGDFKAYIHDFVNNEDKVIICKVNPRDVVSVPNDYNCSKMRVCQYRVIQVVGGKDVVKEFGSDYIPTQPIEAPSIISSEVIVDKPKVTIGANRAYALHKDNWDIFNDTEVIKPNALKSRSFFRGKTGWQVIL